MVSSQYEGLQLKSGTNRMGRLMDVVLWKGWTGDLPRNFDASSVYQLAKPSGKEEIHTAQVEGLLPELRSYQRRAISWMLDREQHQNVKPSFEDFLLYFVLVLKGV